MAALKLHVLSPTTEFACNVWLLRLCSTYFCNLYFFLSFIFITLLFIYFYFLVLVMESGAWYLVSMCSTTELHPVLVFIFKSSFVGVTLSVFLSGCQPTIRGFVQHVEPAHIHPQWICVFCKEASEFRHFQNPPCSLLSAGPLTSVCRLTLAGNV
jgi:hypothetical protein